MSSKKAKKNDWGNVMDSLYEESWDEDEDELHSGISPSHFRLQRDNDEQDDYLGSGSKKQGLRRVFSRPNLKRVFSVGRLSGGAKKKAPSRSSGFPAPSSATRTLSVRNFVVSHEMVVESVSGRRKMNAKALEQLANVDASGVARNYVFDARVWRAAWLAASCATSWEKLRKVVLEGTTEASMDGFYWVAAGAESRKGAPKKIPLFVATHTREYVQMVDYGPKRVPFDTSLRKFSHKTTAHFIYADVVDVGVFMRNEKHTDPLVLVFGNRRELGDGLRGSFSQEESVLMRTNLLDLVNNPRRVPIERDWTYADLPEYGGCYVPHASVIRSNESTGYKFLQKPVKLAFYVGSAVSNRLQERPNLSRHHRKAWERKVEAMLQCALDKGHNSLVLGAWGCGHMENDLGQIAHIMKVAITKKFRGCFKHVVFSFLRDPDAYTTFSNEFTAPLMPYPTRERHTIDRTKRYQEEASSSTEEESSEDIIFFE